MALVKVNDLEKNQVEMVFTIDKETFDKACFTAYKKNVGRLNVPGFRRGKAPKGMVEKLYGKGIFYEDALELTIPDAFEAAVKEASLRPVGRPDYDLEKIDDDGAEVKAKFFVYPKVDIKDYKGLEVHHDPHKVTDADVDAEIESVRRRNAREIEVTDRPAKEGDVAVIDYEGFVDGKAFDGGKGENHSLKLGSGQFIPGFEDQVAGHNPGDEFDVQVKFPDDYHAEELKGKDATFKCKLHSIKFDELPEADDEFAKDVSDFDTFAEYKADVKAKLEERAEKENEAHIEDHLAEMLAEKLEGDIPAPMIDTETENIVRDYDTRLRMQGLDLNTYLKYTGMTLDAMKNEFRPRAESQVKTRLALEKIAELENVTVEDSEVEEEISNIAKAYNMEVEKVKELVSSESVADDIKVKKALELVRAAAKVSGAKKPAAKKSTAKKTADADEAAPAKKPAAKKPAAKKTEAKADEKADAEKKPAAKNPAAKTGSAKPAAKKTAKSEKE